MIFGWIPCGKCIVNVCDSGEWANQWMQQFALEYHRLQEIMSGIVLLNAFEKLQLYVPAHQLCWENLWAVRC